jgi:uncharacterized protein (TIGR00725 family)
LSRRQPLVAVCGASNALPEDVRDAAEVGRLLVATDCIVVCGGLGGVMEAVARGVHDAGGTCIGLLPGIDATDAAEAVSIAIPTGLGEMRNALIARCTAGMIAIGGAFGTLSEIGFALRLGRPVAALRTWDIRSPSGYPPEDDVLHRASSPADAVSWILSRF